MVEIRDIPIDEIRPGPNQPRKFVDGSTLRDLADSIKSKGLLEEILVRSKQGYFEIVHGQRHWRACKILSLKTIRAKVRELTDDESFEISLIENIQREDLNLEDEARAIKKLGDQGLTQEEIGKRVGKTRSWVAKRLMLVRDLEKFSKLVEEGEVKEEEAARFKDDVRRRTVAPEILHHLVKPLKWGRHATYLLERAPTVREAREAVEKAEHTETNKDRAYFEKEVWPEFSKLYRSKEKEYLDRLRSSHRNLLKVIQGQIEYAQRLHDSSDSDRDRAAKQFKKKWNRLLYIRFWPLGSVYHWMPEELLWEDDGGYRFHTFYWWRQNKSQPIEKLVSIGLKRLKKLVEMDEGGRWILFKKFQEEFSLLKPDTEKVDANLVLWEIPENIWKDIHRCLVLRFHPDKGGDVEIASWVNKLHEGMKALRDWK